MINELQQHPFVTLLFVSRGPIESSQLHDEQQYNLWPTKPFAKIAGNLLLESFSNGTSNHTESLHDKLVTLFSIPEASNQQEQISTNAESFYQIDLSDHLGGYFSNKPSEEYSYLGQNICHSGSQQTDRTTSYPSMSKDLIDYTLQPMEMYESSLHYIATLETSSPATSTIESTYPCLCCKMNFGRIQDLRRHYNTKRHRKLACYEPYKQQPIYFCGQCYVTFSCEDSKRRHVRNLHPQ
ncbi:hypothetical protein DFQ30_008821, partial [Apophysomyces sp. BC1015]